MATRSILVTGATGKQGKALIEALATKAPNKFRLYALTRSKASASAQALAKKSGVELIEGNLDDTTAIFKQIPRPLWGAFVVPILDKGVEKEQKQCVALVDAAVEAGVSRIIFTATDRGGQTESEDTPTPVPHFASKFNVEQHIKQKAQASAGALTWTFLRPVAFMENMNPGFFGKAFQAMWELNGQGNKVQFVSTKDVGRVGAEAFLDLDNPKYKNNAVSIAGDELDIAQVATVFKEYLGSAPPATFSLIGWAIRYFVDDVGKMFAWFKDTGFGVDIPALRKEYPYLMDVKTWLREESGWKK